MPASKALALVHVPRGCGLWLSHYSSTPFYTGRFTAAQSLLSAVGLEV
jgi:hypothetical protein